MQVKYTKLREDAIMPFRGHAIDVGLDVAVPEAGILAPGPNVIPTGFAIDVPIGYNASMYPRTGMASGKKTLDMEVLGKSDQVVTVGSLYGNGVALLAQLPPIDPGYSGEVHMIVINTSNLHIRYDRGTRFGQLVFHPIAYANLVEGVDNSRGHGAMGSTGIK